MSGRDQSAEDAGAACGAAPSPGFADPTSPLCREDDDEEENEEEEDEEEEEDDYDEEEDEDEEEEEEEEGDASAGSTSIHNNGPNPTAAAIRPRGGDSLESLLEARKLILVLDLDHTLLNSVLHEKLSRKERTNGFTKDTANDPSRGLFQLKVDYRSRKLGMLVKLRPFVHKFLEEASAMFQMHVYTMGTRHYARACAKLLDPDDDYFGAGGARIISRDDSGGHRDSKSLDLVVPADERAAVVILDDTEDVWEEHGDNLIVMSRYYYFASSYFLVGPGRGSRRSLAEQGKDESGEERGGTLATTLGVLRRVHETFFESASRSSVRADVRVVLGELRRQVLSGCTVAFGRRVIPADVARPEEHPVWRMAERLGAVCAADVVAHAHAAVTHVVATLRGTQTARWAVQNGRFLVHSNWLHAANFSWKRPDEQSFPVNRGPP